MGDYWLHGSSSRGWLWPPFFCRHRWLVGASCLLCRLRHDFFDGGGWAAAPLSRSTHRVQSSSSLRSTGSDDGISCNSTVSMQCFKDKYSTILLEELTSWEVVSVTFSFLATRFRATLCSLLGGAGRLASKLVSRSSMRGILGSPGWLKLDHS
jgi:hypothetical protein